MSESSSLLTGLIVIVALVSLISVVVRGRGFRPPSLSGLGGAKGRAGKTGNRSPIEVFFALFAVANLAVSPSAAGLGAPLLVVTMIVLVAAYALFSDLGLLIVIFGAVAAVADIALAEGTDVMVMVLILVVFLAWIFGAVGQLKGT